MKKVNTNTNIGSIFRNYNYNKKLVDLDDIVLCNDIRLRKELYEIYKKQNKEIKNWISVSDRISAARKQPRLSYGWPAFSLFLQASL